MAVIVPPAEFPLVNADWAAPPPQQVNRSGWTGRTKVIGLPGAQAWTCKADFVPQQGAAVKAWRGFFFSLRGKINHFDLIAVEEPQTTEANPAVGAGATSGYSLPLTGLPLSATVLDAGDMMTVPLPSGHARLVVLEEPLISDGSGEATAVFSPDLGEVPDEDAEVEIQWPYARMRHVAPPGWSVGPAMIYGFAFEAEEAL